jgi:RNA polymerase sigma-70 factor (ECF subfamily)
MARHVRPVEQMISETGLWTVAVRHEGESGIEQAFARCRRTHDLAAFGKVVDAYEARIYGFVLRMVRDEEDALDVTQEVFVRAFQSRAKFDGRCSLRTWLFRIAHNLCVDRHRRGGARPVEQPMDGTAAEPADARWDPEAHVLDQELRAFVEHAVEGLSDKLRSVLLLHDKEGLGYEEIAEAVGVPVGTVKSRLFLARAHLKQQVSQYMGWTEGAKA